MEENVRLALEEVLLQADSPVITGILLTFADHYPITRDTLAALRAQYPKLLLKSVIPKNNDLQKAIGRARSIFEIAPQSKGATAYLRLLKELDL